MIPYDQTLFNLLGMRLVPKHNGNQKFYILPVDISQMQVPFKSYKPISSKLNTLNPTNPKTIFLNLLPNVARFNKS
jgi:hypothetical protein